MWRPSLLGAPDVPESLKNEAAVGSNTNEATTKYFSINLAGNQNSYVIKIQKQRFRSLVNNGAKVSLLAQLAEHLIASGWD